MQAGNMNRFYELIRRRGIGLLMCFLVLTVSSFLLVTGDAAGAGRLEEITGGVGLLETQLGYSEAEARNHFTQLGEAGREHLLLGIIPLDMLFLLSYTALLITALVRTALIGTVQGSYPRRMRFLLAVPLAAGLADLLENLIQMQILLSFPDVSGQLLSLMVFFTPTKFILLSAAILLLLSELISAWLRFRLK